MIVVKLMGGLGNQMFQYVLGRTLSIKHDAELALDISFLNEKNFKHTYRKFILDRFNIKATVSKKTFNTVKKINILDHLRFVFKKETRLQYIKESFFHFDKNILESPDNCYLDGYWQSFKYFENIAEQIRTDFSFSGSMSSHYSELLRKINSSNSVSIHVRRGDYITNPETSAYHGYCSMDYYNEAIRIIKKEFPDAVFFVFSDDPTWIKNNFQIKSEFHLVSDPSESSDYFDLWLLSSCRHAIIANSSFSWWGAWLNHNPEKVVIAPAKWFSDASINTFDLIPSQWLRI